MKIERWDKSFGKSAIDRLLELQSPGERSLSEYDLREALMNPHFYVFVAIDDEGSNEIVGMSTVFIQRNLARWIAEIHDVVVDEEHRRQGMATALTQAAMGTVWQFSKNRRIKIKLFLTSRPSRVAANELYKKLGFVLVAKAEGEWGTNLYKIIVEPRGFRGLP